MIDVVSSSPTIDYGCKVAIPIAIESLSQNGPGQDQKKPRRINEVDVKLGEANIKQCFSVLTTILVYSKIFNANMKQDLRRLALNSVHEFYN